MTQLREEEAFRIPPADSPIGLVMPLLLAGIETTINRLLARDPAAPSRLSKLADKRLLLRFEKPAILTLVTIQSDGLSLHRLEDADESDANAIVELSLDTLCELASGRTTEQLMFDGKLAVRGDIRLLEQVRTLLMDMDINWEDALAQSIGSVPANALANGLKRFGAFGIRTTQELKADLHDYTFEEARILAGRDQMALAREQLTRLEISTDRIEARFERIKRHFDSIGAIHHDKTDNAETGLELSSTESGGDDCSSSGA